MLFKSRKAINIYKNVCVFPFIFCCLFLKCVAAFISGTAINYVDSDFFVWTFEETSEIPQVFV